MWLPVQHHNPVMTTVTAESTLFCHLCPDESSPAHTPITTMVLVFPHATVSHFTGQFSFCVCVPDYIPALCPTSSPPVVWAAASSWASAPESEIRVRLQSVPLPPLLMLQARERAAGSPAATQIQPAKARTQAPGRQSATVCHFNPHAPTGLLERERERERDAGRKEAREGREATEREKEHPEAEGSFCDMWTMIGASESLTAASWMFAIITINRWSRGKACKLTLWT